MSTLKAEFDDHRVCKKCGAPAEKFMVMTPEGYRHRTVTANYRDPVSYTCCNDITDGCPSGGDHGGMIAMESTRVVPVEDMPDWCFNGNRQIKI